MGRSTQSTKARRTAGSLKKLVRRYRPLRKNDIIRKTDEYFHRFHRVWLKTQAVFVGERYCVKRFVKMRRPMPNTGRDARREGEKDNG